MAVWRIAKRKQILVPKIFIINHRSFEISKTLFFKILP